MNAGTDRDPAAPGSLGPRLVLALVLLAGAALLALHVQRYPPAGLSAVDTGSFSPPDPGKFLAMLRTLAWLALVNASAWSLGALLELRLPLPRALDGFRTLYRLGIGLALLALLVLLLASVHLLLAPAFGLLLLAPPALYLLRGWPRVGQGERTRRFPRLPAAMGWIMAGYALLLVTSYFRALGDDPGWDALTYHLAFPERYLATNGIVMTPFSHLSGYIANTEMLYLLALALDGPGLAVLIHFEFGLLTLAAVWTFARRMSLRAAALAPLILLADPLFQTELGWGYSDLSLAFYVTLATIASLSWLEDGDRRSLLYAGIGCGIACQTRYLGAEFTAALVVLMWLAASRRTIREKLAASFALPALSAVAMLPWLVRNVVFTGNPLTPLLQSLFHAPGAEYIAPIVMEQSAGFLRAIGMGRDFGALIALPWNLVMESTPGTYGDSFGFQVGPLYLVGLLAALAVGEARRIPAVSSMLKLVAVYTLLWFYTFQEARFLLPVFPLIALTGAMALDRAMARSEPWGHALLVLPAWALLYCQLLMLPSLPVEYASVLGSTPADSRKEEGATAAAAFLRGTMGENDKLMLWLEERAYLFRGLDYIPYHIGSGSPTLAFVHRFPHGAALQCGLQEIGISHLLINREYRRASPGLYVEGYGPREFLRDLNRVDRLMRDEGELLFESGAVRVYGLPKIAEAACD